MPLTGTVGDSTVKEREAASDSEGGSTMSERAWYLVVTGVIIVWLVFVLGTIAYGQETRLEVDVDTVHKGDPGDLFLEGSYNADAGEECVATLESVTNNDSIHPDNDLIVGPVVFTNIESGTFEAAGIAFTADGPGDVMVRLGSDGVFSAGFTLEVTCNPTTTTTTTASSTTTSSIPAISTTVPSATPTTLSEPPVGGISTGGGACADGACDGWSLSPWQTWILIGVAWSLLAGLAWAFVHGATSGSDG